MFYKIGATHSQSNDRHIGSKFKVTHSGMNQWLYDEQNNWMKRQALGRPQENKPRPDFPSQADWERLRPRPILDPIEQFIQAQPKVEKLTDDEFEIGVRRIENSTASDDFVSNDMNFQSGLMQTLTNNSFFWLKQRKHLQKERKLAEMESQEGGSRRQDSSGSTLVKSFSYTGRQREPFCATNMLAPIHWNVKATGTLEKKRRRAKNISLRRAYERDIAYQEFLKTQPMEDTSGFGADEKSCVDQITSHIFSEIWQAAQNTSDFRSTIPVVYHDAVMIPPDIAPKEPPELHQVVTWWWQKKGALPPKLPNSTPIDKGLDSAKGGGAVKPEATEGGRRTSMPGADPNQEAIDNKGTYFGGLECEYLLGTIALYQKCTHGGMRWSEDSLRADRLFRSTFCRFLIDCDCVELDALVVANCGRIGKAGLLYTCKIFDSMAEYDLRVIQKNAQPKRKTQTGAQISSPSSPIATSRDSMVDPKYVGTISIKEDFLKLMEKVILVFDLDHDMFFEESLTNARTRIEKISQARAEFERNTHYKVMNQSEEDFVQEAVEAGKDPVEARELFRQRKNASENGGTGPGSPASTHATSEPTSQGSKKKGDKSPPPPQSLKLENTTSNPLDRGVDPRTVRSAGPSDDGDRRGHHGGGMKASPSEKKAKAPRLDTESIIDFCVLQQAQSYFLKQSFCEPEMWLVSTQYEEVFSELFDQFSDFPTDLLGCPEGHMSYGAFLRFLVDFSFFPQILSYADAFEIYHEAECCVLHPRESNEADPASRMLGNMCNKWLRKTEEHKHVTLAEAARLEAKARSSANAKAQTEKAKETAGKKAKKEEGKKDGGKKVKSGRNATDDDPAPSEPGSKVALRPPEYDGDTSFWTKPFEQMTKLEYITWGLLSALEAWLHDRGGNVSRIFALFDIDGNGTISPQEFHLGMSQTRLDPIPTPQEINWMFDLIDEDSDGTISLSEMHKAMQRFTVEREKKQTDYVSGASVEKMTKKNMFLKIEDYSFSPAIVTLIKRDSGGRESESEGSESEGSGNSSSATEGKEFYCIFGKSAFQECLFKIAFLHLIQNGNSAQKCASSYVKMLWLIGYMRAQYIKYNRGFEEMIGQEAIREENEKKAARDTEGGGSNSSKSKLAIAPAKASGVPSSATSIFATGADAMQSAKQHKAAQKAKKKNDSIRENSDDNLTVEQEHLLEKIQALLNTAKTEYFSPLERLLKLKWDPFEGIESFDRDFSGVCNLCGLKPDPETGYAPDPSCLSCSPIILDDDKSLTDGIFWTLIQPLKGHEEVQANGLKRSYTAAGKKS